MHRVIAAGNTSLRSIFLDPDDAHLPEVRSEVLNVSPLLHELVNEAGKYYGEIETGTAADQMLRLIALLLFQSKAAAGYVDVPRITHPRLVAAFEGTAASGAAFELTAEALANRLALSPRQFRRLIQDNIGMSFKDWRALARVRKAVERLASGESLSNVATELSFSSSSALGVVFKRHTGMTPSAFVRMQRFQN